jgi:predicted nuclease of restriction endonuclease-like (RecB) superfamily
MARDLAQYGSLLEDIKHRIAGAQIRAALSANAEMISLYWDIGRMIEQRQQAEGWGTSVIPRLSRDLHNDLPEIKGFSERNIGRMVAFYREYPAAESILPQSAAKLQHDVNKGLAAAESILPQPVAKLPPDIQPRIHTLCTQIPWMHNILLIEKVKDLSARLWYMQQTITQGWSRNVLQSMIESDAYRRQGSAATNFHTTLPAPQSDLARDVLKNPYVFDFLTLDASFRERELETGLIKHLEKFLLELGAGFAFVGRQYHLDVGGEDFYLDLLFYHLKLRCFVVIDLKVGPFRPEYAGKMNFYCNAVDDRIKHESDQQTIGLILCQDNKKVLAEYALRGMDKPIGISEYELTRALPDHLKSSLPTIEQLEKELGGQE